MMDEEITKGSEGRIIMKMNSVTDVDFIKKVSEASCAGVKVDLIVRGICCIQPGVPGFTDNVRVMSVVGRYLNTHVSSASEPAKSRRSTSAPQT